MYSAISTDILDKEQNKFIDCVKLVVRNGKTYADVQEQR
jgi:hypothetical protein